MSTNFYLAPAKQEHAYTEFGECVNLTYENALQWATDNVKMEFYDDFNDWYSQVVDELSTPALTDKAFFVDMALDAWNRHHVAEDDYERPTHDAPPIRQPERKEPHHNIDISERQPTKQPIRQPEPEPTEQTPTVLPATGNAPIITTQKFNFSQVERKSISSRIKGGLRRLLGR